MTIETRIGLAERRIVRLDEVYGTVAEAVNTGAFDRSRWMWRRLTRLDDARQHARRILSRLYLVKNRS